jgi:radical SAM superfamily enzyme YgiQ (UPF0313 family)
MVVAIGLGRKRGVGARGVAVALVGRESAGDENLSLRYLAGALLSAGHRPIVVSLDGPGSLAAAARRIERAKPAIVGLSMPDADVTIDALAFVRYLRTRGYRGHVTCGGPLATLVRQELLENHPGIDSVIRHDGELPLVELAERVGANEPWSDIAGISTREGDGPPARVADPTPLHTHPMHADPLPRLLGVGTARLSASRGCPGRCPYCGPAALQRDAIKEARNAGLSRDEWLEAGVGKTRFRHHLDLAEEVADLYHRGGARFFQLVDENVLSGGEERAAYWLEGLMKELHRLGVGRTAWCLQADPATLTPKMIELLEELGVIRVSVGIEGLTTTQLRALGRWGETTDHLDILRTLSRRGIVTSFNSIIVHPQTSAMDIERELHALSEMCDFHFDVLSMAVYPGTRAYETLQREGRLTGGMLSLRFEPVDVAVKRFRAALIRLRVAAMGRYGVHTFAHDVAINVALARRLQLSNYDASLEARMSLALTDANRSRLQALETALALARADLSDAERYAAIQALTLALRNDLSRAWEQVASIQHRLQGTSGGPIARSNLMFGSAIAASFVLCLSSAACGGKTAGEDSGDAALMFDAATSSGGTGGASGSTIGIITGGTSQGGTSGSTSGNDTGGRPVNAGGLSGSGGSTMTTGTGGVISTGGVAPSVDASSCDSTMDRQRIDAAISANNCVTCDYGTGTAYGLAIDPTGHVVGILGSNRAPVPDAVRACYMDALAGQIFPCLSGEEYWYECYTLLR